MVACIEKTRPRLCAPDVVGSAWTAYEQSQPQKSDLAPETPHLFRQSEIVRPPTTPHSVRDSGARVAETVRSSPPWRMLAIRALRGSPDAARTFHAGGETHAQHVALLGRVQNRLDGFHRRVHQRLHPSN